MIQGDKLKFPEGLLWGLGKVSICFMVGDVLVGVRTIIVGKVNVLARHHDDDDDDGDGDGYDDDGDGGDDDDDDDDDDENDNDVHEYYNKDKDECGDEDTFVKQVHHVIRISNNFLGPFAFEYLN